MKQPVKVEEVLFKEIILQLAESSSSKWTRTTEWKQAGSTAAIDCGIWE